MSNEINYSDGDIENEILETLRAAPDVSAGARIAPDKQDNWAFEYHLSDSRANLIRHLNFKDKKVLEIGAGMGAISRFVAEQCDFLQIVEGTGRRLACLKERLRGLDNYDAYCGNFKDFETETQYDVVLIIGVLEYAEIYYAVNAGQNPFVEFLKKAKRHLAPGGALVVAIENRLGLKYWAGATEDHTGKLFDGILGYPECKSVRTFSRAELTSLFEAAGISRLDFQYPIPDYKLPKAVLTSRLESEQPSLFTDLAGAEIGRDYSRHRVVLFSDSVCFESLQGTGLLGQFANSFLVLAADGAKNLHDDPSCLAYSYSLKRTINTVTKFTGGPDNKVEVTKRLLASDSELVNLPSVKWLKPKMAVVSNGRLLVNVLNRLLTFRDWERFEGVWHEYLAWLISTAEFDERHFRGESWDKIPQNIMVNEGHFSVIDQEWVFKTPVRKTYFVLRCLLSLSNNARRILCERYGSIEKFYQGSAARLGVPPSLVADCDLELQVQSEVTGVDVFKHREFLEGYLLANLAASVEHLNDDYRPSIGGQDLIVVRSELARTQAMLNETQASYQVLNAKHETILNSRLFKLAQKYWRIKALMRGLG